MSSSSFVALINLLIEIRAWRSFIEPSYPTGNGLPTRAGIRASDRLSSADHFPILEHDPEKWKPVFEKDKKIMLKQKKDHAQTKR
jgi:hypothetical protein